MQRWSNGAVALLTVAFALGVSSCTADQDVPSERPRTAAPWLSGPGIPATWALIEDAHRELQEMRQELANLEVDAPGGENGALDVVVGADPTGAVSELRSKQKVVAEKAEDLSSALVSFLDQGASQDARPAEELLAAKRLKSDEDLLLAMEWVNREGDFRRAEILLQRALELDPDYEELQSQLAWVTEMRFVDKERFDLLQHGMSQDEVRARIGQVNLRNIKTMPDEQVGWFYRKEPETGGGAAVVVFGRSGGEWRVAHLDFGAVPSR